MATTQLSLTTQDAYMAASTLLHLAGLDYPGHVLDGYTGRELAQICRRIGAKGRSYVELANNTITLANELGKEHSFDPFTSLVIPTPTCDSCDSEPAVAGHDGCCVECWTELVINNAPVSVQVAKITISTRTHQGESYTSLDLHVDGEPRWSCKAVRGHERKAIGSLVLDQLAKGRSVEVADERRCLAINEPGEYACGHCEVCES